MMLFVEFLVQMSLDEFFQKERIPNFFLFLQFETQRNSTQKKFTASLLDLRSVTINGLKNQIKKIPFGLL